jgi:WXXGXW repeat (2 copies)
MRTSFYLLMTALVALIGCVAEVPTTVTTTTTTREVTTTGPAREVLVTRAPPPVRVETQTVAPGPRYVWTSGYWRWTGVDYVWVPGTWVVRPSPAAVWVPGHWVRRPGGWVWIAGHWR